jgi:flagellar biosynthesis protein FlhA
MFPRLFARNKDLILVFGTLLIIMILFSPIPPAALDFAIILNFGLGFTILLMTFYVAKPVDFSTFPSLLLVATLFRLSLNVAATRLILTGANAGDVINSIGSYAVQGNFVIGLVVFAILVVVQYVVVTSGAQRVSEVAARFTLDSMPGQQMSIDADLNLGLIDQNQAQERRKGLEKEAAFYGAMDGASKFVKGDAIAGIIILLINIIGGLIVGVAQMGMGWQEALERFTLLTIGDGIATQLPALIISIATGIIVTRSSADRQLSSEIFTQLSSVPRIPIIVVGILLALMLLPGMPKWPIAIVVVIGLYAWIRVRRNGAADRAGDKAAREASESPPSASPVAPIEIRLGTDLAAALAPRQEMLLDRIGATRRQLERQFGFAFPKARIKEDERLGSIDYEIALGDVSHGGSQLHLDRLLALKQNADVPPIEGISGKDPAFGIEGVWIDPRQGKAVSADGYSVIDPESVLMTHFSEIVKAEMPSLLTRAVTVELLDQARTRQPGLVEELVPNVMTVSDVQRVLQGLLQERVSIGNVDLVLETLVDVGRHERDPSELTERVRQKLSVAICSALRGHHVELAVLSLDPRVENRILAELGTSGSQSLLGVDPKLAEQLLRALAPQVDKMIRQGRSPVVLCAGPLRRILARLVRRTMPQLSVISVDEVPLRVNLVSFGVVRIEPVAVE